MSRGSASWRSDHALLLYLALLQHCAATRQKCLSHYVGDGLMFVLLQKPLCVKIISSVKWNGFYLKCVVEIFMLLIRLLKILAITDPILQWLSNH